MPRLDPLVPNRGPLGKGERIRTARHLLLDGFGADAQARLAHARVVVIGAGGLGSPVLLYLAAAGVGTIGIVDDDVVEISNLQRQIVHTGADVGRSKAASAAESAQGRNPLAVITQHAERLDAENADRILAGYDLVVDGSDSFTTRYAVADAAERLRMPVVWGTVLRWDGQVSVFWPAAPGGGGVRYRDVFGPMPAEGENCATAGVLSPACGVVGATMAVEAIKLLTGTGEVALGRVLVYDARTSRWDEVPVAVGGADAAAADPAPTTASTPAVPSVPIVSAAELRAAIADPATVVLDVREEGERGVDHIPGDRWAPLATVLVASPERETEALADLPRDARVIVYCATGRRSARAVEALRARGWSHAASLDGGFTAWPAAS